MKRSGIQKLFEAAERFFSILKDGRKPSFRDLKINHGSGLIRDRDKERAYYAASTSGPSGRWNPSARADGDTDIIKDGAKVRARIRDLERNNSQIAGTFNRYVMNVVGEGMFFQSKAFSGDSLDLKTSKIIEDYHAEFAENACVNGDSLYDIQSIGFRSFLRDGECLIIRRFIEGMLKYQMIEPEQLDESLHGVLANNQYAIKGITFNSYGMPVSYRVLDAHPGDTVKRLSASKYQDVPADDVFHLYNKKRPSQRRGMPEFASIILDVFDSAEYTDATMTIARLAAAYGIFVETPYPEDHVELTEEESVVYGTKAISKNIGYVSPAALHYVRPGEIVKTVNPNQPSANYESFIATRDRRAAVGAGQSYESFSGDYSKATYSSARQGMLLERQLYRFFSAFMDKKFNYPSLKQILQYGILTNRLALPGYESNKKNYLRGRFTRPRHEWIDLANEARSNAEEIKLGTKTRRMISEDRGDDWQDVVAELAAEETLMKELGLGIPASVSQGSSRPIIPDEIIPTTQQSPQTNSEKPEESTIEAVEETSEGVQQWL